MNKKKFDAVEFKHQLQKKLHNKSKAKNFEEFEVLSCRTIIDYN